MSDFGLNVSLLFWFLLGVAFGWVHPAPSSFHVDRVRGDGVAVFVGDVPFGVEGFSIPPFPFVVVDWDAPVFVLYHEWGHVRLGMLSTDRGADMFALERLLEV